MRTLDIMAGTTISRACHEAVSVAKESGDTVNFTFNGVDVVAAPDDHPAILQDRWRDEIDRKAAEYRETAEYRRSVEVRDREIKANQEKIDRLIRNLPSVVGREADLMAWVGEFAAIADDSAMSYSKPALAAQLERGGYRANDCVGMTPDVINADRSLMARYIVGQVIDCLRSGTPPHPAAMKFVGDYMKMAK